MTLTGGWASVMYATSPSNAASIRSYPMLAFRPLTPALSPGGGEGATPRRALLFAPVGGLALLEEGGHALFRVRACEDAVQQLALQEQAAVHR